MATARELLEHADALMRRNRAPGAAPLAGIPASTEPPPAAVVPEPAPRDAPPRTTSQDDDVPVLTDVVEDFDPISIMGAPEDSVAAGEWPDFDDDDAVVIEGAQPRADPAAPAPAMAEDRAGDSAMAPNAADDRSGSSEMATTASTDPAAGPLDAPERRADSSEAIAMVATPGADDTGRGAAGAVPHADEARWNALAEEVRMQVLQRIDIFTDTGLQEQLAARLQPIVDRASADLVAAINHHVGQLMRSYVAEAIEREIDKWRQGGGS